MNGIRVLCCLTLMAFSFSGPSASAQQGGDYLVVPNAQNLLEHLVRHSDELLTEVNVTRANQFLIVAPVLGDIRAQGGWGAGFYGRMLVDPNEASRIPEYFIGKIVNDFRLQTILLYDFWYRTRGPSPAFNQQFAVTDYAYTNALAATYFYIEALRRSFIIRGATGACWNQDLLVRRLVKLERLAWELRELMLNVRYATLFQLPLARACLECTYRPYRVNVQMNVAQNFVPFPFYHENRMWNMDGVSPVAAGAGGQPVAPAYNAGYWDQRFQYMDNSYINGYQTNLPGNFDQRPYTPVGGGPDQGLMLNQGVDGIQQGGAPGQVRAGNLGPQAGFGYANEPNYQGGQIMRGQQGQILQGGQQGQMMQRGQQGQILQGGQVPQQRLGNQGSVGMANSGQNPRLGQTNNGQSLDPLAQQGQSGTQPGYPVQAGAGGNLVPSNDYSAN